MVMRCGLMRVSALVIASFSVFNIGSGLAENLASFWAMSEGVTTCGEFTAQPGVAQAIRMEWVLGYISGRNREASSPRERSIGSSVEKTDTILGWLQSYCKSHALDRLVAAADVLRAELQRREEH